MRASIFFPQLGNPLSHQPFLSSWLSARRQGRRVFRASGLKQDKGKGGGVGFLSGASMGDVPFVVKTYVYMVEVCPTPPPHGHGSLK